MFQCHNILEFYRGSSSQLKQEENSINEITANVKNNDSPKQNKSGNSSFPKISSSSPEKDIGKTYIKKVFYKDPIKTKVDRKDPLECSCSNPKRFLLLFRLG